MREHLIGYLLDALDPAEREAIEAELAANRALQAELELLRNSLEPLECDAALYEPPTGLAERTCLQVARQATADITVAPRSPWNSPAKPGSTWRLVDWLVGAGVLAASLMLFIPALQYSRINAQKAACADNLYELYRKNIQYAQHNHDRFPDLRLKNSGVAAAGIYAPKLRDNGLIDERQHNVVLCPAATTSTPVAFKIPSTQQVIQTMQSKGQGKQLAELQRSMGGSYGYHVGQLVNGELQGRKNAARATFALMADAPNVDMPNYQSLNHGGQGQNVLFEDGRVIFTTSSEIDGDDIYVNDDGQFAPGVRENDSVIGHSGQVPIVLTGGH